MGQKAEEQKDSTVETRTSIRDMTGKLSLSVMEEIDMKMGLAFIIHLLKWEKLFNQNLWSCGLAF